MSREEEKIVINTDKSMDCVLDLVNIVKDYKTFCNRRMDVNAQYAEMNRFLGIITGNVIM